MAQQIGKLLAATIERIDKADDPKRTTVSMSGRFGARAQGRLPVVVKMPTIKPEPGEAWKEYRERIEHPLMQISEFLEKTMDAESRPLVLANAVSVEITPDQITPITEFQSVDMVELDPRVQVVNMDDAIIDIEVPDFMGHHPNVDGRGVVVAVLDSGIDTQHPHLNVHDSVSTCGESTDIPGSHGTHCAGIVASQDPEFSGVAPGATLINVKVLRADGSGTHTDIVKGIDEAIDRDADILSMSLGFNHLPAWSDGGHGWMCTNGHCPLCTAVDNATALDNRLVVVAAGNEHNRAEALRKFIKPAPFDTELGCPGQARDALTVGALTKTTFLPASFTSHGPTSYGEPKPNISAPGVNIMSTIPVPRDAGGAPVSNPPRADMFGRKSGTSMATPIVAGAAALVVQNVHDGGGTWTPSQIKDILTNQGVRPLLHPANVVGSGRLDLRAL